MDEKGNSFMGLPFVVYGRKTGDGGVDGTETADK
jgi:hypothetical protein